MKNKEFDAVEMMRHIREPLGEKYTLAPEAQKKDLAEIHHEYGLKPETQERLAQSSSSTS